MLPLNMIGIIHTHTVYDVVYSYTVGLIPVLSPLVVINSAFAHAAIKRQEAAGCQ